MKRFSLFLLLAALLVASCSTKKNTASSRKWQAFVTRYNVYFNAEQAYIEGRSAQDKGLKENYTDLLPLFGVGYEKQRSLGKSNFETAVTKCEKAIQLHSIKKKPATDAGKTKTDRQKAWLSRKEFNPFLKNAWLLMGKAQFQQGNFSEAAATFSYITRFYAPEPAVVAEARVWLARCYAELDWFYDAEDVLRRMERDTFPQRLNSERDLTMADWHIRQEQLEEALPYLQRAARKMKGKVRKARLYYLLGQTYMALDRKDDAYKALGKCIAQNPSYEMTFHARILQTEAISNAANAKSMVKRLRRMAKSDINKDYLDQVYYAIGNIHLLQGDTVAAVSAYETGRKKATQRTLETAVLLLRLGEIYWDQRRFDKAQGCYTEAIGLIDKEFEDYNEINRRSKVLDALVPPTSAVHLQDSLQWLASISESEREAAINRVIEELKKREEEERKAKRDSAAEARRGEMGDDGSDGGSRNNRNAAAAGGNGSKEWYFYNIPLVNEGKQAFRKNWGNRKNEDDWRRSNRTVLANDAHEAYDYAAEDSLEALRQATADSLLATGMSEREVKRWFKEREEEAAEAERAAAEEEKNDPVNDPHQMEYYLAQIPFTPEQKAESDSIIRESLFEAAVIEKDQLEDFSLAAETFGRLQRDFPQFSKMDEVCYQLFLLYNRWSESERRLGNAAMAGQYRAKADAYREQLRTTYPDYAMTPVICDPDFERNARYGRELEDSLYTLAYDAYRKGNRERVEELYEYASTTFPKGLNRPKFIFVHALSRLGVAHADTVSAELRNLVQEYPKSDVAEMAGMIVKGLEAGRGIGSGSFDIASLWNRRTAETAADNAAAGADRALTPDRDIPFVFLVAYPTGMNLFDLPEGSAPSANDDMLLYNLARFNFSAYVFRGFDIVKDRQPDITQFRISGFRSFDDVHGYAQRIFHEKEWADVLRKTRIELISEQNLQKLGSLYTFEDYRQFYDSCFVPLDINPELPLEFEPDDDAAEAADYEENVPDASLYLNPEENLPENNEEGAEQSVRESEEMTTDDEKTGTTEGEEEYYDEDEPSQSADDDEIIVVDDAPSRKSAQTGKDDGEIIVVDDAPSRKSAQTGKDDGEIIVVDDAPSRKSVQTGKDDDETIVVDDAPSKKSAQTSKDDGEIVVVDDTSSKKSAQTSKDDEEYDE